MLPEGDRTGGFWPMPISRPCVLNEAGEDRQLVQLQWKSCQPLRSASTGAVGSLTELGD
jgi:hypothetical protein